MDGKIWRYDVDTTGDSSFAPVAVSFPAFKVVFSLSVTDTGWAVGMAVVSVSLCLGVSASGTSGIDGTPSVASVAGGPLVSVLPVPLPISEFGGSGALTAAGVWEAVGGVASLDALLAIVRSVPATVVEAWEVGDVSSSFDVMLLEVDGSDWVAVIGASVLVDVSASLGSVDRLIAPGAGASSLEVVDCDVASLFSLVLLLAVLCVVVRSLSVTVVEVWEAVDVSTSLGDVLLAVDGSDCSNVVGGWELVDD